MIDQRTYFNKVVASKDMSSYYLLKKGEFAYNKSFSIGFDYGAIKRLEKYDMGALSTLYICFSLKEKISDKDSALLVKYFDSKLWYNSIRIICAEGARNHGLLNVPIEDFFKIKIYLPSIEEQKKITDCLSALDRKIEAEKKILADLEELKKGLLQGIFNN